MQTIVMMLVVMYPLTDRVTQAAVMLPHEPATVEECMTEAKQFLRENPEVVPPDGRGFYTCGPRG